MIKDIIVHWQQMFPNSVGACFIEVIKVAKARATLTLHWFADANVRTLSQVE